MFRKRVLSGYVLNNNSTIRFSITYRNKEVQSWNSVRNATKLYRFDLCLLSLYGHTNNALLNSISFKLCCKKNTYKMWCDTVNLYKGLVWVVCIRKSSDTSERRQTCSGCFATVWVQFPVSVINSLYYKIRPIKLRDLVINFTLASSPGSFSWLLLVAPSLCSFSSLRSFSRLLL